MTESGRHFLHIPPWCPDQDPPWSEDDIWVEHVGCPQDTEEFLPGEPVTYWTCDFDDFFGDIGFVGHIAVPEDPDRGDKPTLPTGRYAVDIETFTYHTLDSLSGLEYDAELRVGERVGDYTNP